MQSRTGAHPPAARQPWPPELPKRGVGGCSSPRGAASPPSLAVPASPTRLAPVTFSTVQLPPKLQRDAAGPPGRQLLRSGQPRTLPALRQPSPLGMPMGTQPSLTHPAASSGMGWAWFTGVGIIPKLALDSHSRAREQIRDLTLPVFPNCGTHARHSYCYFNVS